jgi:hypothetical protein
MSPMTSFRERLAQIRALTAASALAALTLGLIACGGEDSQRVLDQTFSAHPDVRSGKLEMSLRVAVRQNGNTGGYLITRFAGPFESRGGGEAPKFDLTVDGRYRPLDSPGADPYPVLSGSLTSTGDAAYLSYDGYAGTALFRGTYRANRAMFAAFERAASAFDYLPSLLTNLSEEGDANVGGTPTQHISADLDLDKTAAAIDGLLANVSLVARQEGLGAAGLPQSPAIIEQLKRRIEAAHVDLYSGKDDHILRRLTIDLELSGVSVREVQADLEVSLTAINQPQSIEAPPNAKPFSDLVRQFLRFAAAAGN